MSCHSSHWVAVALLRAAIELTLAGQPVPEPHRPSMGCSIKWRF
jgi:hypothetical protein